MDDEEDFRSFATLVLEANGYVVDGAGNGREAIRKIEANAPDLVVLDLMMPVMNGWEVLDWLRARAAPSVPTVVVVSAYAEMPQALEAGAVACVAKPFALAEFVDVCQRALEGGQRPV